MPEVSVIIPSYNYASYLDEAIDSALVQKAELEVIVVDDGSVDDSLAVIRRWQEKDGRVRLFQHPDGNNHGLAATLRLGLEAARGEWVAVLEADDVWLPDCLEARLVAASQSGAEVVFSDVEAWCMPGADTSWFDAFVPRLMATHTRRVEKAGKGPYGPYAMRTAFFIENQIPTFSCAMLKRELALRCDLNSPVPQWVDRWVWCQAAQTACFAFVPRKLTRWRLHVDSFNQRHAPSPSRLAALGAYLERAGRFWQGLRRLPNRAPVHQPANILLRLPNAVTLALRLGFLCQSAGIKKTAWNVIRRLHAQ